MTDPNPLATVRSLIAEIGAQFTAYAEHHDTAGETEKALTNLAFLYQAHAVKEMLDQIEAARAKPTPETRDALATVRKAIRLVMAEPEHDDALNALTAIETELATLRQLIADLIDADMMDPRAMSKEERIALDQSLSARMHEAVGDVINTTIQVGDTVRYDSDDGSMGTAQVIAIAMDHAWCFYSKANCHRVQKLAKLERLS